MALRDAAARGADVRGATVYVTLEPCSHHGRTPPCAEALVEAGIGRVVIAMEDPNPLVAGRGAARLRAAGIAVASGPGAEAARELNIGFVSRMTRGRPWLRLKVAISLDGRTALANGESQWITGEAARTDGHAWRKRAGAVLTGVGTVLEDDPRLDVRLVRPRGSRCGWSSIRGWRRRPRRASSSRPGGARLRRRPRRQPPRGAGERAASRSRSVLRHAARSTSPPCSTTSARAASTSCTSRPARSSMPRCCARAWSTSCSSTSRPRSSAAAAPWPRSAPSSGSTMRLVFAFHDVTRIGDDLRCLLRPAAPAAA